MDRNRRREDTGREVSKLQKRWCGLDSGNGRLTAVWRRFGGCRWRPTVAVVSEMAGRGHGKRRSLTALGRVGGDVGSVADGHRQAGSGMASSRARARVACSGQGQPRGRCKVSLRAERVSRPAIEKKRRRRVLVVTNCSPRPMRAAQRARDYAPSPVPPARRRWRRSGPRGYGSARRLI